MSSNQRKRKRTCNKNPKTIFKTSIKKSSNVSNLKTDSKSFKTNLAIEFKKHLEKFHSEKFGSPSEVCIN